MALIQQLTTPDGTTYEAAHWRCPVINSNALLNRVELVFYAWSSTAAFQAGKPPVPNQVKGYLIEGQAFYDLATGVPAAGLSRYQDQATQAEAYALACQDTPTGAVDADGSPVLASFFANATQQ